MAGKRKASGFTYTVKKRKTGGPAYTGTYKGPASVSRYTRTLANPETKYFDLGFNTAVTAVGTSWADTELLSDNYVSANGTAAAVASACMIPTENGSGYGQVNGNKYKLKQIRAKGVLALAASPDLADTPSPRFVRMLLVHDSQPNGAQAQGEDVMQDLGEFGENGNSFMRLADNIGRFRVVKDKTMIMNVSAVGTDGANTNSAGFNGVKWKLNYKPKFPIDVSIRSGTSTHNVSGTINCNFFILVYGYAFGGTTAITVFGASRAYFCEP